MATLDQIYFCGFFSQSAWPLLRQIALVLFLRMKRCPYAKNPLRHPIGVEYIKGFHLFIRQIKVYDSVRIINGRIRAFSEGIYVGEIFYTAIFGKQNNIWKTKQHLTVNSPSIATTTVSPFLGSRERSTTRTES